MEWKNSLTQNIIAFLSLPWLGAETSGLDLTIFKDKYYRQCSLNIIQNTPKSTMLLIKRLCIQLLCLLPKNVCPQWRTHIIGKCIKEETNEDLRVCAIDYLPYLISFLGVSSNSLVFQLIHPAMLTEKSLTVLKAYAQLLNSICCLVSRKSIVIRKSIFSASFTQFTSTSKPESADEDLNKNLALIDLRDYFEIVCTCCDKKRINTSLIPKLVKRKNIEMLQMLFNRPKNVDNQVLIQFVYVLSGTRGFGVENNGKSVNDELMHTDEDIAQFVVDIKSTLLKNLERAFNHLEFNRYLNQQTLTSSASTSLFQNNANSLSNTGINGSSASGGSSNQTSQSLTYIYKETVNMLSDESLSSTVRFDFARLTVSKMICNNTGNVMSSGTNHHSTSNLGDTKHQQHQAISTFNDEQVNRAMNTSIFSLMRASDNETQFDHNFNFENQLCEGFLRAKTSKNLLDLFMFIIGLGRLTLSFTTRKPDEYIFLCVKHLLEIINSSSVNQLGNLCTWKLYMFIKINFFFARWQ